MAAAATTVLGIAQAPAFAAPSVTTPTISISAKSALKPVTGDVFVVFRGGSFSHAQIKGSVTGATSGEALQLFAGSSRSRRASSRTSAEPGSVPHAVYLPVLPLRASHVIMRSRSPRSPASASRHRWHLKR